MVKIQKIRVMVLASVAAVAVMASAASGWAQDAPGPSTRMAASDARRAALVTKIVEKWSAYVEEAYHQHPEAWAAQMASSFEGASAEALQQAADARTFTEMNSRLIGVTAQKLGEIANDLVMVPITPCRVADTRLTSTPIAANSTASFDITAIGNYSFQGGDNTDCSGAGAAGSFAAAIFNFTVVSPSGGGYITAYPFGTVRPTAATVNYNTGDIKGNLAVVKLDQGASANELSIYSFSQTHVVVDLVGYFINPQPTELQCQDTAETVTTVAANSNANSNAPACPAGYTSTATNCESSTWEMPFVFFHGGTCSARNNTAFTATLRASQTCCRVPGR